MHSANWLKHECWYILLSYIISLILVFMLFVKFWAADFISIKFSESKSPQLSEKDDIDWHFPGTFFVFEVGQGLWTSSSPLCEKQTDLKKNTHNFFVFLLWGVYKNFRCCRNASSWIYEPSLKVTNSQQKYFCTFHTEGGEQVSWNIADQSVAFWILINNPQVKVFRLLLLKRSKVIIVYDSLLGVLGQ